MAPITVPSSTINDLPELYQYINRRTCRVEWEKSHNKTSGCLIKINDQALCILTCFHNEDKKEAPQVFIGNCRVNCTIREASNKHDFAILDGDLASFCDYFKVALNKDNHPPKGGDEVFFSGYPANESDPLVHSGHVSSVKNTSSFRVDASVVQGFSGGPVVSWKPDSIPCLIGIMSTQIVNISNQLLNESRAPSPGPYPYNAPPSYYKGQGSLQSSVENIQRDILKNLNLGIGKAIPIQIACQAQEDDLAKASQPNASDSGQNKPTSQKTLDEIKPVSAGKIEEVDKLVGPETRCNELPVAIYKSGSYLVKDSAGNMQEKSFAITARELRKPGAGPRTMLISIDGLPNSAYKYRISNPHGGNYNKNQEKVYNAAAGAFVNSYADNLGAIPQSIEFAVKKEVYKGELQ